MVIFVNSEPRIQYTGRLHCLCETIMATNMYFHLPQYFCFAVLFWTTCSHTSQACRVDLPQGHVLGETIRFAYSGDPKVNTTLDVFKGIPYAEPPTGSNRFRRPIPKGNWDQWNATRFNSICWQVPDVEPFIPPQSEDCLYLNIWSPDVQVSTCQHDITW